MSAALTDTEKRTYRIGNAVIDASLPPAQWEFTLDDVWKVLKKLPRYLGGSSRTVAQHSLAVGDKAVELSKATALAAGMSNDMVGRITASAFCRGCWHDASEAFTGDIPGPMKRHLNPRLRDFEDDIQEIVYRRAGVGTKEILEEVGTAGLDIINRAVSQADADDYREEQAAMAQPPLEDFLDPNFVADFQEGHSVQTPPPGAASSTTPPQPHAAPRPLWADLKFDKDRLLDHHEDMCGEAWRLMSRKNNDYAGAGGTSPFKNFLHAETLGLCTVEQGMVVRLSDKLQRLAHFVSGQEMQVKDEALQDTILDIINYAVLISAYTKAKKDGSLQESAVGMYTELYLGTKLRGDTPAEVFSLIEQAIEGVTTPWDLPDHPFFKCGRWTSIFCGGGSYYFEAPCFQKLFDPDPICDGARQLLIVVNLKNYDQEIQHFLDWISPYIDEGGHVGHMRYEEDDVPTLLHLPWDYINNKAAGKIVAMAGCEAGK